MVSRTGRVRSVTTSIAASLRRLIEFASVLFIAFFYIAIRAQATVNPPTNLRPLGSEFYDSAAGFVVAELKWDDAFNDQIGFHIYISTNGSTYYLFGNATASGRTFDSAAIPWVSNRWWQVTAYSATEESTPCTAIELTGIMPPGNLGGSTANSTHMTVTWATAGPQAPPLTITGYKVQQDTVATFDSGGLVNYSVPDPARTSTNINFAFSAGVIYYFRALSTCLAGDSVPMDKPISYIACAPNGPPTAPRFGAELMDQNLNEARVVIYDTSLNRTGWKWETSVNGGATWTQQLATESGVPQQVWFQSGLAGGIQVSNRVTATNSSGASAYLEWTFIPPATTTGGPWTHYYVSTNGYGNGAFTGTNWANAWPGFGAINWSALNPDDVVEIDGGTAGITYPCGLVSFTGGTFGHPITVKVSTNATHNGHVTVNGQIGWKSDYVTVSGSRNDSYVISAVKNVMDNIGLSVVGDASISSAFDLYHCVGNRLLWCEGYNTGNPTSSEGEGAAVTYGGFNGPTNSEIAYCYLHDAFGNAVLGNVNAGYFSFGGISIHHNWLERYHNNYMGGLGSSDVYNNWTEEGFKAPGVAHPDGPEGSPTYTRMWNNLWCNICPESGNAINLGISQDNALYHDCAIVNNVLVQDTGFGHLDFVIGHQGVPDGVTISNLIIAGNTIVSRDNYATISFVAGSANNWTLTNVVVANNLIWSGAAAGGAGAFSTGRLRYPDGETSVLFDYNVCAGFGKLIVYRTNNLDAVNGVFAFNTAELFNAWSSRYKSNSSASPYFTLNQPHNLSVYAISSNTVDCGTNLSFYSYLIPAITNDINGSPRGQNGKWDVGAYEYDPSLVLYLDFETFTNGPGSYVQDMSGNGNHAYSVTNYTIVSSDSNYCPAVVTGARGNYAGGWRLHGTNEQWQVYHENLGYQIGDWLYLKTFNKLDLLTNGTWATWAMYTNAGFGDGTFINAGWLDTDYSWDVSRYDSENQRLLTITGGTRRTVVGFSADPVNVWNHYAVTWNATNNVAVSYFNGVAVQTNTVVVPYFKIQVNGGTRNIMFGCISHGGSPTLGTGVPVTPDDQFPNDGWFAGYMDEIRLYNRDLGPSEVYGLYSGGSTAASGGTGGSNPGNGGGGSSNAPAARIRFGNVTAGRIN